MYCKTIKPYQLHLHSEFTYLQKFASANALLIYRKWKLFGILRKFCVQLQIFIFQIFLHSKFMYVFRKFDVRIAEVYIYIYLQMYSIYSCPKNW